MTMVGETPILAPILQAAADSLDRAGVRPGEHLIVGFSGGTDSTCLLLALGHLAPRFGIAIEAAHVDHGLDSASEHRAEHAGRLARRIGIGFHLTQLDPATIRAHPRGLEAGAREERYNALTARADAHDARFVLTAHHADDQAETLLLRLLQGTSWLGLGGMASRTGRLLRPLLGLRRERIVAAVEASGLRPNDDPANRSRSVARSALRQATLPRLLRDEPALIDRLVRIADAAQVARRALGERLEALLDLDAEGGGAWAIDRRALAGLPTSLVATALDRLARRAGAPYPPTTKARRETVRQLHREGPVAVDSGGGWRLEGDSVRLRLVPPRIPIERFAYTLQTPGRIALPKLGIAFELRTASVTSWMFRRDAHRTAFGFDSIVGHQVEIRNRRPGDRLQPFGGAGARRLKDMLIDQKIPRHLRDALPLVTVGGRIAWVPGVTIDHRFRVGRHDDQAWVVTFEQQGLPADDIPRNLWQQGSVAI